MSTEEGDNVSYRLLQQLASYSGKDLSLAEHRVLLVFASFADNETNEAWPSFVTVAERCGMDRGNVTKLCHRLIQKGVLQVVGKVPGTKCKRFRICLDIVFPEHHSDSVPSTQSCCTQNTSIVCPVHSKSVLGTHRTCQEQINEPVSEPANACDGGVKAPDTMTDLFGETVPVVANKPPKPPKPPAMSREESDRLFQEFWDTYRPLLPEGRRARKPAYIRWRQLDFDAATAQHVIASVRHFATTPEWTRDNGRYVPAAVVFLNQERWAEYQPTAQSSPKPRMLSLDELAEMSYREQLARQQGDQSKP